MALWLPLRKAVLIVIKVIKDMKLLAVSKIFQHKHASRWLCCRNLWRLSFKNIGLMLPPEV